MKKKKRFSIQDIRRWEREKRGLGTHDDYRPWHQVRRADAASRGRSHLVFIPESGRLIHALSDIEKLALLLGSQLPDLSDIREQFPLELGYHERLQDRRSFNFSSPSTRGTESIAKAAGIRHPQIIEKGAQAMWRLTTDIVFVQDVIGEGRCQVTAVAVKPCLPQLKRTIELLQIEREYWLEEGAKWLFFVRDMLSRQLRLNLLSLAPWTLSADKGTSEALDTAACCVSDLESIPLTVAIDRISEALAISPSRGKDVFWQSVLSGRIPINLEAELFRGHPLARVSSERFRSYNPILSGVSAWSC